MLESEPNPATHISVAPEDLEQSAMKDNSFIGNESERKVSQVDFEQITIEKVETNDLIEEANEEVKEKRRQELLKNGLIGGVTGLFVIFLIVIISVYANLRSEESYNVRHVPVTDIVAPSQMLPLSTEVIPCKFLIIKWDMPKENGNQPIERFKIEITQGTSNDWIELKECNVQLCDDDSTGHICNSQNKTECRIDLNQLAIEPYHIKNQANIRVRGTAFNGKKWGEKPSEPNKAVPIIGIPHSEQQPAKPKVESINDHMIRVNFDTDKNYHYDLYFGHHGKMFRLDEEHVQSPYTVKDLKSHFWSEEKQTQIQAHYQFKVQASNVCGSIFSKETDHQICSNWNIELDQTEKEILSDLEEAVRKYVMPKDNKAGKQLLKTINENRCKLRWAKKKPEQDAVNTDLKVSEWFQDKEGKDFYFKGQFTKDQQGKILFGRGIKIDHANRIYISHFKPVYDDTYTLGKWEENQKMLYKLRTQKLTQASEKLDERLRVCHDLLKHTASATTQCMEIKVKQDELVKEVKAHKQYDPISSGTNLPDKDKLTGQPVNYGYLVIDHDLIAGNLDQYD